MPLIEITCTSLPPEKRLTATYVVPNNPPAIVRLRVAAEDAVGNIATGTIEFPTKGDFFGTITWFFQQKEDTSLPPNTNRSEAKLHGSADIVLTYDGRGNLTGTLNGSLVSDINWWGYPAPGHDYSGQVCRSDVVTAPVKGDIVGSYTPGPETVTLQARNVAAKLLIRSSGGGPNLDCSQSMPLDYSGTLTGLLGSRLQRGADGIYRASHRQVTGRPNQTEFWFRLKLQKAIPRGQR
jgi:hypothetical protein